jgi:putative cell wall-binding protein
MLSILPANTQTAFAAPDPNVIEVSTPADLAVVRDRVNSGADTYVNKTVKLMNDIDLSSDPTTENWVPIGRVTPNATPGYWDVDRTNGIFAGVFDGQGHIISGLYMDETMPHNYYSFFVQHATTATLKNFVLRGEIKVDPQANGNRVSAAAISYYGGSGGGVVENVGAEVDIDLTGRASSSDPITANGDGYGNTSSLVAGITLGSNTSSYSTTRIVRCYNKGNLASWGGGGSGSSASAGSGGIVGNNRMVTVVECYNLGTIEYYSGTNTGGIAGVCTNSAGGTGIYNSYNAGQILCHDAAVNGSTTQLSTFAIRGGVSRGSTLTANNASIFYLDTSADLGDALSSSTKNIIPVMDAELQGTAQLALTDADNGVTDGNYTVIERLNSVNAGNTAGGGGAYREGNTYPVFTWEKEIASQPVITTQPVSGWSYQGAGGAVAATPLSVSASTPPGALKPFTATGGGYISKVEWFSNTTNSTSGGSSVQSNSSYTSSDTTVTSTYAPPIATLGETFYYVEITLSYNDGAPQTSVATTTPVSYRVVDVANTPDEPVFVEGNNPANQVVLQHSADVVLSAEATSPNEGGSAQGTITYQWYQNTVEDYAGATTLGGEKAASYTVPTAALGTFYYFCKVTNTTEGVMTNTINSRIAAVRVHGVEIRTAEDLYNLQQTVNAADDAQRNSYLDYTIELLEDIDLSVFDLTEQWTPIGINTARPFRGSLYGYGHTISGLDLSQYEGPYGGLFGVVGNGALIRDLVVKGSISSNGVYSALGGVVGLIDDASTNPDTKAKVDSVGSEVDVSSLISANVAVGGIIGKIYSTGAYTVMLENSYHKGVVAGLFQVGGLVGYASNNAGGSGYSSYLVRNCYNQGSVAHTGGKATGAAVGGAFGFTNAPTQNTYSSSSVTALNSAVALGALVGSVLPLNGTIPYLTSYGPGASASNLYFLDGAAADNKDALITSSSALYATVKTDTELKDAVFVTALNGAGSAFKAQADGYPQLVWEGLAATSVDTGALEDALDACASVQSSVGVSVQISVDGSEVDPAFMWVTQADYDALIAALITASEVLADPTLTQAQANAAVAHLNTALAAFEAAKQPGSLEIYVPPVYPVDESWPRLAGANRYEAMASIVREGWSTTDTVIISTGDNFPDALSASALAGSIGSGVPVILTEGARLSTDAKALIQDLGAHTAIVVGGPASVSDSAYAEIAALVPTTSRIFGADRYLGALEIYKAGTNWGSTAIIASGAGFADALSISPYAFAERAPIFLADPASGLSSEVVAAISAGNFSRIVIVGGEASVPSLVKVQLGYPRQDSSLFVRLGGATRYDASANIAVWSVANSASLGFHNLGVATGTNYPDALVGGPALAKGGGVLLLTEASDAGRAVIDTVIAPHKEEIGKGYFLGGTASVPQSLADLFPNAAQG